MTSLNPLTALLHISAAIKNYCYQTADYRDPAHNSLIRAYLNQHLSRRHWVDWQRLLPTDQAAFIYNQDSLPTNAASLERFTLRLARDRQEGVTLFTFWTRAAQAIGQGRLSDSVLIN